MMKKHFHNCATNRLADLLNDIDQPIIQRFLAGKLEPLTAPSAQGYQFRWCQITEGRSNRIVSWAIQLDDFIILYMDRRRDVQVLSNDIIQAMQARARIAETFITDVVPEAMIAARNRFENKYETMIGRVFVTGGIERRKNTRPKPGT